MIQIKNKSEDYILITGASAGIGLALAKQFAQKGFSLIITARRTEKLENIAQDIRQKYAVKVIVISCDLSKPDAAQKLFEQTSQTGVQVSGLVNNAGFGIMGAFQDSPLTAYEEMLQVMLLSCVRLSYLYSPAMIERGYGWIINVASLTAFVPASEGAPLYSPIKKFLLDFSQAHGIELRDTGVHVTALCPGMTYTDFFDDERIASEVSELPTYMWMEVDLVAKQGVEAVLRGDSFYINGKLNKFFAFLGKVLPDRLGRWIVADKKSKAKRPKGAQK